MYRIMCAYVDTQKQVRNTYYTYCIRKVKKFYANFYIVCLLRERQSQLWGYY